MTPGTSSVEVDRLRSFLSRVYDTESVKGEDGTQISLHPHGYRRDDGEALRQLVVDEGAVQTLETGFCLGLSTLFICDGLLSVGGGSPRHICIDPFQKIWRRAGVRTVRDAGVENMVDYRDAPSQVVLPTLLDQHRNQFDVALVDGDHRFEGAFVDLFFMQHLVKPGGVIVIDDVWMPAVAVATGYFVTNLGFEIVPNSFPGPAYKGPARGLYDRITPSPPAATAVIRRPQGVPDRPWWDGGQQDISPFREWLRRSNLPNDAERVARRALREMVRLKRRLR